ncbi:MAG: regulatory protein TetR [Labilithrix sp.]|nr:regulatory protein TetR [Labilithrix sp.]
MSRIADPKAKIMLLRAAEEVFAEKGLAGAKVEEIARRAGVSKGAFYLHFESKETALKQLLESFLARCHSYFAPPAAYPGLPEDPADLLDFSLARDVQIYEFLWQNRAFLRILPSCQGNTDYLVIAFRAEIDATTREWVDYWRREGIFRPEVDADLAATLIGGAYNELSTRMLLAETRPQLEDWLRFALETFFRAFGTPEMVAAVDFRNQRVSQGIGGRVADALSNQMMDRSRATRDHKERRHI